MKWTNSKTPEPIFDSQFMKVNSSNFIDNEKFNCELVHEKNVGRIEAPSTSSSSSSSSASRSTKTSNKSQNYLTSTATGATVADDDKEKSERRTMSETVTLTESRTDFNGSTPKRYTTKCYLKPATVPYWYTESVLLKIGSTKKVYTETVHFKNKFAPFKWSENMSTEVKTGPKCIVSGDYIPLDDDYDDELQFHYMSLEPQQNAANSKTPITIL